MLHTSQGFSASPWFHLLASPIIWGVYFLATYSLVEAACQSGFLDTPLVGLSALSVAVLLLTLIALLATLYAGWAAYHQWRTLNPQVIENEVARQEALARHFMALSGVWLSALFSLTLLATGLPALVLSPCQAGL
jgi:hypothetical protein